MAAEGGRIDFMFLTPPYPAAGSATELIISSLGDVVAFDLVVFLETIYLIV